MRMKTKLVLLSGLLVLPAAPLFAATPLFDFETAGDLAAWKWASQGQSKLERSPRFATSGESSLCFTTPAWKTGQPEWPSFEAVPPETDWTSYDRLVVDITSPDPQRHVFDLFVTDSKLRVQKGLSFEFEPRPCGFQRYVIPLSTFPPAVNRKDIRKLHLFTDKPKFDLAIYIDNLVLLRKGESLPEPGAKFVQQIAALTGSGLAAAEQTVAQGRESVPEPPKTSKLKASARAQWARLDNRIRELRAELAKATPSLARLDEINRELSGFPEQAERIKSLIRLQRAGADVGWSAADMAIGFATSMEKILPRAPTINLQISKEICVNLARNEKESFQVAVVPVSRPLRKVSVRVSDLKSASGVVFKHEQINCDVVGYVETKTRPPYESSHIGWWPDPLLNFLGPVDIAAGDVQSFWIRVRAPKDQPPGLYHGRLKISASGASSVTVGLAVRVYGFTLPDHSPLPLAITFSPEDNAIPQTQSAQAEWRKSEEYPVNAWKKHRLAWADMLADYYISYDSLYHHGMPDFEVLTHLHQQGRLGPFNLGYYGHLGTGPDAAAKWRSDNLPRLRAAYTRAKELGLLDHAYIYGCDEAPADLFALVQQAAAILKEEFPDVLVMTTTYDQSYGMNSVIKSMDAFCPLTPSFDPAKAAAARAAGRQVWWYICCGPHHPHANMFVEYPAIEGRLLMGAMTAKQRPDGFLYYQISIWNSPMPIASGPFTDWDPRSWTTYHGDGSWTCVGPAGAPLPTIRLENFRDGLEDYAYAVILEEMIRQRELRPATLTATEQQWLAEAKQALAAPESLVKSMTEYSRDPSSLYDWRNRLGDLIDRSGLTNINPWGTDFGVRGFKAK